jgi:hypothetical protein
MSNCRAIRVITPNDSPEDSIASNTIRTARSRSSGGYRRCAGCEPLDRSDMNSILPSGEVPTRPGPVQPGYSVFLLHDEGIRRVTKPATTDYSALLFRTRNGSVNPRPVEGCNHSER